MSDTTASFEAFFDECYDQIRRSLAVALADPQLGEDAAQEAFARAYSQWRTVSQMDRPAGWVYVVALRGGRRQRAKRAGHVERRAEIDPATQIADTDSLEHLLARLPERQRIAVVLRYVADLSLAETAEAMGCAVGTVKSTLHSALARLRVEMTDLEEGGRSDAPG